MKAHSPRRGLCVLGSRQHRHPSHPYTRDHSTLETRGGQCGRRWLNFDDMLLLSEAQELRTRIAYEKAQVGAEEYQGICRRSFWITEAVNA